MTPSCQNCTLWSGIAQFGHDGAVWKECRVDPPLGVDGVGNPYWPTMPAKGLCKRHKRTDGEHGQ